VEGLRTFPHNWGPEGHVGHFLRELSEIGMTLKQKSLPAKQASGGTGSAGQGQASSFLAWGRRKWVDICFDWNAGKCLKAPGSCTSMKGTQLRHVCNWIPDKSKPNVYCEKAHARCQFH
jgi:hypothetical protein